MSSTFCWYCRGTANRVMMTTNTNRLSTVRLYSVAYPAKNWPPGSDPATTPDADAEQDREADVERHPQPGLAQ